MKSTNRKSNNASPIINTNIKWGLFTFDEHTAHSGSHTYFSRFNPTQINLALESDCDYFAVVKQSKDFKPSAGLSVDSNNSPISFLLSDFKQEGFFKRLFVGADRAKELGNCILLNRAALAQLSEQNISCESISELHYHLKKAIIPVHYQFGNQKTIKKDSFLQTRIANIQQFVAYYFTKNASPQKWFFITLAVLGFFHVTLTSQKAGISGDEFIQH